MKGKQALFSIVAIFFILQSCHSVQNQAQRDLVM